MSEQMMGVDYFSLETNAKDDDKIFDLKYRYGMPDGADDYDHAAAWAAYGRFVELLASIYQDGFAIEVTKQRVLRMSQQLGMTAKEFQDFVQTCVDVGLFDDGLWCREKVLTSRGIQKRYFHAVKRRKGEIPEEYKRWILIDSARDEDNDESSCNPDANTVHTSCAHGEDTMKHDAGYIEKKRIGKKRKEKEKKEEDRKGASSSSNVENVVENLYTLFGDSLSERPAQSPSPQPYPLACMSTVFDPDTAYNDDQGGTWDTPWDALLHRFAHKTGSGEITDFVRAVAKKCPKDCAADPQQVSECYALLSEALDKFDPSKAASPTPLALKVLEDRGKRKRNQ